MLLSSRKCNLKVVQSNLMTKKDISDDKKIYMPAAGVMVGQSKYVDWSRLFLANSHVKTTCIEDNIWLKTNNKQKESKMNLQK